MSGSEAVLMPQTFYSCANPGVKEQKISFSNVKYNLGCSGSSPCCNTSCIAWVLFVYCIAITGYEFKLTTSSRDQYRAGVEDPRVGECQYDLFGKEISPFFLNVWGFFVVVWGFFCVCFL